MAVAYDQTPEVLNVLRRHVSESRIGELLRELSLTMAAQRNRSFAETVARLQLCLRSYPATTPPEETVQHTYKVVGVWKLGTAVSGTYDSKEDAEARMKSLRDNPAIQQVRCFTYEVRTRCVGVQIQGDVDEKR